jgi:uncharacterized membrane protein
MYMQFKQEDRDMFILFIALLIGVVAGLRALTPLAAISWAARVGILRVSGTWLAFLSASWSPWVFTLLALGELVNDKLPQTPSRKTPIQFGTRILTGSFSGLAIGLPASLATAGLLMGAIGAVIGTLSGAALREKLAAAIGRDLPIALLEDCVAIFSALVLMISIG